ncbi:MAG: glutathione S-transferase family protein [Proteobacteria bacterium]|nr:glutathione S-transferase family protein [Pseudomonadota bacterium]
MSFLRAHISFGAHQIGEIYMYKLYGKGQNRWVKPYWTLRELGVDFEEVPVNLVAGETRTPEFKAINPYGKLPAFVDGDFKLYESSAICTYLADKHCDNQLIPKAGTHDRGIHDQWMSFITSELEQPLWTLTKFAFMYPEAPQRQAAEAQAKNDFAKIAKITNDQVSHFLVGQKFSTADICMAYTLRWATSERVFGQSLLLDFPNLKAYLAEMTARPKFPKHLYL